MNFTEQAFTFDCAGENLLGIIAVPVQPKKCGVLIVVGGPQYRVGSHRQFLLLSRALAKAGYPTMRFDYRGMGDSTGNLRSFETVNDDIAAAIAAFYIQCPNIEKVVLWGLCDAASANLLYYDAIQDNRIGGLVMLNPWVRSETTLARAHIKHYYGQRLLEAEFWRKLMTGKLGIAKAIGGLISSILRARQLSGSTNTKCSQTFQKKMANGLSKFSKPVLLILSGNDYTAKEFLEAAKTDSVWITALQKKQITQVELESADHTFSSADWRQRVEVATACWVDETLNNSTICGAKVAR